MINYAFEFSAPEGDVNCCLENVGTKLRETMRHIFLSSYLKITYFNEGCVIKVAG
jgi:hypothetical protein